MDPKNSFSSESSTFPILSLHLWHCYQQNISPSPQEPSTPHDFMKSWLGRTFLHRKDKTIHINAIHLPFISLFPVSSIRGFPQEGDPFTFSNHEHLTLPWAILGPCGHWAMPLSWASMDRSAEELMWLTQYKQPIWKWFIPPIYGEIGDCLLVYQHYYLWWNWGKK